MYKGIILLLLYPVLFIVGVKLAFVISRSKLNNEFKKYLIAFGCFPLCMPLLWSIAEVLIIQIVFYAGCIIVPENHVYGKINSVSVSRNYDIFDSEVEKLLEAQESIIIELPRNISSRRTKNCTRYARITFQRGSEDPLTECVDEPVSHLQEQRVKETLFTLFDATYYKEINSLIDREKGKLLASNTRYYYTYIARSGDRCGNNISMLQRALQYNNN